MTTKSKSCSFCKKPKPAVEFYKRAISPDKLSAMCKVCYVNNYNKKILLQVQYIVPKNYFSNRVTDHRKDQDGIRNYESKKLSNEQLASKINEQIQRERAGRELAMLSAPIWIQKLDWNTLLQTKLFNNVHI